MRVLWYHCINWSSSTYIIITAILTYRQAVGAADHLLYDLASYPTCEENTYAFQGYTYTEYNGYRLWSHCNFFNPHSEPKLCQIDRVWSDVYICDPEELLHSERLNATLGHEIGDNLQNWVDTFKKDCPDKKNPKQSIVVAMVVLEDLKMTDSSSNNVCLNECGEIHPFLDSESVATGQDRSITTRNFAIQLISNVWKIGLCENQIAILYLAQTNELLIYAGSKTYKRFGEEVLDDLFSRMELVVEEAAADTELGEVLLQSISLMTTQLRENMKMMLSPATTLLIAFIAFLLLLLLAFILVLFTIHKIDFEK